MQKIWYVTKYEFKMMMRRAAVWVLLLLLALWALLTYHPNVMRAGEAAENAEIILFMNWTTINWMILSFFILILFAGRIARDKQANISEIIFSSGVRSLDYVWGKYLGILASFLIVYLLYITISILLQLVPWFQPWVYGFHIARYFKMFIIWGLPFLIFMGALSFVIGTFTGKPILSYLLAIVYFIVLITKSGDIVEAPPKWLALTEPAGMLYNIFLIATGQKVARSAEWWNTHSMNFPVEVILSRVAMAALGLMLVFVLSRTFKMEEGK